MSALTQMSADVEWETFSRYFRGMLCGRWLRDDLVDGGCDMELLLPQPNDIVLRML